MFWLVHFTSAVLGHANHGSSQFAPDSETRCRENRLDENRPYASKLGN